MGAIVTAWHAIVQVLNRFDSEPSVARPVADAGRGEAAGRPIARGVERSSGLLLTRLGAVMTELADEYLAEIHLTGREYAILSILVNDGPGSQLELAQMIGKAPALVVPSIDRLEHARLVERTRDPSDRRRTRVKVTPEGSNALARGDVIADRVVADTLQGLDDSERAELAWLLQKGVRARPAP